MDKRAHCTECGNCVEDTNSYTGYLCKAVGIDLHSHALHSTNPCPDFVEKDKLKCHGCKHYTIDLYAGPVCNLTYSTIANMDVDNCQRFEPLILPFERESKPEPQENEPMDIVSQIGLPATLEQLAEECCELGHAALKLARFLRGQNPTRKNKYECQQDLEEEMGDVLLCVELIQKTGLVGSSGHIDELINGKYQRWVESLSKEGK